MNIRYELTPPPPPPISLPTMKPTHVRTIKRGTWRVTETEKGNPSSERFWTRACVKRGALLLTIPREQEQTKFDDLRRGICRRLAKYGKVKKDLPRNHQEITDFKRFAFWPFWPPTWLQKSNLTWSAQLNFGVPDIFNCIRTIFCLSTSWTLNLQFKSFWVVFSELVGHRKKL